jgi:hypothetical protein
MPTLLNGKAVACGVRSQAEPRNEKVVTIVGGG